MKRKRMTACLILFAMIVSFFGGSISSQAKKSKLSLSQKKLTLQVGQKKKLKVKGTSAKVKWSSSNKKVATVSKKGVVKAKKKGKAVITAKAGKWRGKARVVVKSKKTTVRPQNTTSAPTREPEDSVSTPKPEVTVKPEDGNPDADISKDEKIPKELQEIPSDYFTETEKKGSLVELNYETYESKTYEQKSKRLNKRAIV